MVEFKKYGWIPDVPDHRDLKFKATIVKTALPKHVDLRVGMPAIYDQGELGSCTANGIAAQFDYIYNTIHKSFITPSRLFIYYGEREIEGSIGEDSGAMIRDGIKYVADKGTCKESTWAYNINKFTEKPSQESYNEASKYKITKYQRVNSLTQLKQALAQGMPVVFGFSVYESFESTKTSKTGIVTKPRKTERILGGHCVLAVGYDTTKKIIIVRNSWGTGWGDNGYCYFPESYFTKDLTDDFWAIQITT